MKPDQPPRRASRDPEVPARSAASGESENAFGGEPPMSMPDYLRRLRRIWLFGFFGTAALFGVVKWQNYKTGQAEANSLVRDVLTTLAVSLAIPTLIVVRAYFRYKQWLREPAKFAPRR